MVYSQKLAIVADSSNISAITEIARTYALLPKNALIVAPCREHLIPKIAPFDRDFSKNEDLVRVKIQTPSGLKKISFLTSFFPDKPQQTCNSNTRVAMVSPVPPSPIKGCPGGKSCPNLLREQIYLSLSLHQHAYKGIPGRERWAHLHHSDSVQRL